MSLSISPRTIVRDTILDVLATRTDKSMVRVPNFSTSQKYLNAQESKTGNTYCVIVTDESPTPSTFTSKNWSMQVKIVCYANHPTDPHGIIDAMIEDLNETMALVRTHGSLHGVISRMDPEGITADERTTEAGPWGQAVCTWTMDHERE